MTRHDPAWTLILNAVLAVAIVIVAITVAGCSSDAQRFRDVPIIDPVNRAPAATDTGDPKNCTGGPECFRNPVRQ